MVRTMWEAVHWYYMQHVSKKLYKEAERARKKEKKSQRWFQKETNKQEETALIHREMVNIKENKKSLWFLKKIGRRLENDNK
jgi:endonuclease YncB( thermonuclease family)